MRQALTIGTVFLSAFLLFAVQLMLGKRILPWFGGTPAVWTTCMLFFQTGLLAGYAYAHGLGERLRAGRQAILHIGLLLAGVLWLGWWTWHWGVPLLADDSWKPVAGSLPQGLILGFLLVSIGLPFVLLSTTSPLLQRWHSLAGHGEKSYRLYAVSNAGSLLGLVSYPFVVERLIPLETQAWAWATGFVLVAAGCGVCAWWAAGTGAGDSDGDSDGDSPAARDDKASARPVRTGDLLIWLLLTMSTSAMLLAVTNELCQEVAAVPFLWMLPLVLYLLSFVICFDRPQWYRRRIFLLLSLVATLAVLVTAALGLQLKIPVHIASFGGFLFLFCMTCHGELVRRRPPPERLTLFYLVVALGGALGGVFVALVAPRVFGSYWEFNIMVTMAWLVLAVIFLREKGSLFHRGDVLHFALALWLLSFVALRATMVFSGWEPGGKPAGPVIQAAAMTLAPAAVLTWLLRNSPFARHWFWPRFTVGAVIFLAECFMVVKIRSTGMMAIATERNFFGTLSVRLVPPRRDVPTAVQLTHGRINHGIQYVDDELRRVAVSYYGPNSGIDYAIRRHPRRLAGQPMHIGVLGLGAGTMAAFAEPGDRVRFYEINPAVIRYAVGEDAAFSYVEDSPGRTSIVEGDARLSLERELRRGEAQQFDVLAMDAFSSDSVPVHLLTAEAFEIYRRQLRDEDSILAINTSNRFLNFSDLVANQARDLGLEPLLVLVMKPEVRRCQSSWMLLTRSRAFLNDEVIRTLPPPWQAKSDIRWTDSFSGLIELLR